ncbi:THAP domain-containing protein 2 [Plakobranchus ocellatus]|uniref:THAP domain-containing protein 2 n=1 Tax=Plakobranchus ocellatus TaxID=259542 RepID=A0AAV3YZG1_9GAST|nr:THAP domain-containing protein 2 [Plakobranchus ocellatus]
MLTCSANEEVVEEDVVRGLVEDEELNPSELPSNHDARRFDVKCVIFNSSASIFSRLFFPHKFSAFSTYYTRRGQWSAAHQVSCVNLPTNDVETPCKTADSTFSSRQTSSATPTNKGHHFHAPVEEDDFQSQPFTAQRQVKSDAVPSIFSFTLEEKKRVIIDATEFYLQKPGNPTQQQASFSNYKNNNTLKALIGIAPSGAISFISDLWLGGISDQYLTRRSGLLEKLEAGDTVLADRGFTSLQEECEKKGI